MKTKTPLNRIAALFALALLATFAATHEAKAQLTNTNWIYNFGTSTGTFSNNAVSTIFLPAPPAGGGEDRVRVGGGGGSFTMTNVSGFGSGSALVARAPTSGAVNKFSIYDWSDPGSAFSLSFDMRLTGGTNGFWSLFAGNGQSFSNSSGFTGAQSFLGLRFGYGTGGAITTSNRAGANWASLSSGISQSNNYSISIFGNNSSSNLTYIRNGLTYTNTTNSFHFWVGTNLVGTNLAKAQLTNGTSIDSFMFYGESSTGNLATIALDNFNYANYLVSEVLSGNFWAGAAGGGGSGIWTSSSTNWATGAGGAGRGGTQATSGALVFTNTAGTVDVGGPVTVNAGMQFATDGYTVRSNTITLAGTNAAANTITTDTGVGTTINSVLAGSTGMTKAGNGTLTLGGANTYTGGTAISGGRLVGSTTSLQGNITNNAALTFNQTTNGTFSSAVSGTGSVVKSGAGTLTLGGANTYTGGTTVSGGRLVGDTLSLQGNTANTAALTFSQTTNGTYGGVISGTGGTVTKSGTGTVTFTQNNTYTGATTVGAGRLVVNGSQGSSAVTVNSGASLAGSGTVGALTVNGLLSPGNSIGTLDAGNTTFAADGAFELEMFDWTGSAGTGWDLLDITGNLTISSTSLNPFTIDLVSFSDATTPGFSVNFNANQSFTNTFVTYSGSLTGFAADLFVVDASSFLNGTNGTFSITNVTGGLALLYTTAFNPGASYDWNAGSGNWSVAGNWAGNATPTNNSLLLFTGVAGTATNNAAVTSVTGVIFSNTSGSIALAGDAFALGEGGIANNSANTHTISNNISLDANASILASSNGLTIAGNITNDTASRLLTVGGSENTTISGAVSGQGDLSKISLGTLTLSGANTFTGNFTVGGGEAIVSGTAATTTIAVNSGGTLSLGATDALANGATVTVDMGTFNTATFNDTIGTLVLTNGGTVSGTGVLGATTFTLGGGTVSGALGAGTANVTGEVSLTGTMASTTINVNTGGTLTLGSADRIGNSTAVVIGGGTLALGANNDNDTVGTFSITSGTLGGKGTLTASSYALGGGTVSANLGAGAATAATGTTTVDGNLGGTLTASGGTVNLNGTLADDLTVSSGAVNLGAANRLADTSDVSISGGTLGLGANNDTVGTFALTGGTLGGTGTLTAATYALNGGTIDANIGAGAATASSGTTTLNGSLLATTLAIDGGTVALGSNGRINNDTAVTLSAGVLDMDTFLDGVGSFTMTGGTVDGSGTLSSVVTGYDLQGGTINANLGTGTATVSTGTTELNGNLGGDLTASSGVANVSGTIAGNVTVSGGTVNVESADRIGNTSAVSVSSGTLDFAANDTVGAVQLTGGTITGAGTVTGASYDVQSGTISAALAGAGAMTKTGAGTTTLSANSSGFSGAVAVNDGAILASTSGALGTGAVEMSSGSTLAASGVSLANNFTIGTAGGNVTNNFTAYWNFGTAAAGDASATTTTGTGLTFGTVSQGNNNGTTTLLTTTSASSGYVGASGTYNAGAAARTGALNTGASGSAYFEFSLTADSGYSLSLTNLTFGSRSTGTAPQLATLLSSIDSYVTALATNALANNNSWALISPTVAASTETNGVVTFRIYGSSGTGSPNANTANWRIDDLNIAGFTVTGGGLPSGSGTLGIEEAGTATFSGNIVNNNEATFTAASGGLATFSGIVSGEGTLNKTGAGTVTLSGASANTFTGMTTVSAGTLQLDKTAGTDAIAGAVTVNSGAVLLISASNQVNNSSEVSLSGGTITRGSGVSEVFGNLNVSGSGFLDFGTGTAGTLGFGTYTPSSLLTINNFGLGNTLTFGTDLTSTIGNSSFFQFQNGGIGSSSWNQGTSTFTITAIPEPSTYLAAAGLLAMTLWPSRKRLLKNAKKILGLTPPMRDRLASRRA